MIIAYTIMIIVIILQVLNKQQQTTTAQHITWAPRGAARVPLNKTSSKQTLQPNINKQRWSWRRPSSSQALFSPWVSERPARASSSTTCLGLVLVIQLHNCIYENIYIYIYTHTCIDNSITNTSIRMDSASVDAMVMGVKVECIIGAYVYIHIYIYIYICIYVYKQIVQTVSFGSSQARTQTRQFVRVKIGFPATYYKNSFSTLLCHNHPVLRDQDFDQRAPPLYLQ